MVVSGGQKIFKLPRDFQINLASDMILVPPETTQ